MDTEQAQEAVQANEAAPVAGAENEREHAMTALLSQMTTRPEHGSPESVAAPEPAEAMETTTPDEAIASPGEEDERRSKNFRGRWDHLDDRERRVMELTAKKGLSLNEAFRAVYGVEGAEESTPTTVAPAEAPAQALEEKIASQQHKLDELKRLKAEARGDLAEYDKAADAYLEAREELRELRSERSRLRERETAQAIEAHRAAEAQAQAALREEYPDALTPGTELFEACSEELRYLEEANSPLIRDPQVLYKVARRFARALGVDKAAASRRSARPVPASGSPLEAPAATLERKLAGARSPHAMLELMREIGTPFEALLNR